jgi:hypothetical protein
MYLKMMENLLFKLPSQNETNTNLIMKLSRLGEFRLEKTDIPI